MTPALNLTRDGLVRALSAGVRRSAAVDAALRARAGEVARRRGAEEPARIVRHEAGRYTVEIVRPAAVPGDGGPASLPAEG